MDISWYFPQFWYKLIKTRVQEVIRDKSRVWKVTGQFQSSGRITVLRASKVRLLEITVPADNFWETFFHLYYIYWSTFKYAPFPKLTGDKRQWCHQFSLVISKIASRLKCANLCRLSPLSPARKPGIPAVEHFLFPVPDLPDVRRPFENGRVDDMEVIPCDFA